MSKQLEESESLDPYETLRAIRDINMGAWSKMMIDLVNSETYSHATSKWLDNYLTFSQPFQHTIETIMTQVLAGLNMPTRSDVTSLAERLTNVEIRLDDLDAKLDAIQRTIQALSTSNLAADTSVEGKEAH